MTQNNQLSKDVNKEKIEKRKRVAIIKRIIVAFVIMAIVVPSVFAAFLFVKLINVEKQFDEFKADIYGTHTEDVLGAEGANRIVNAGTLSTLVADRELLGLDGDIVNDSEEEQKSDDPYAGKIKVCLTFDDGPSYNTNKILDILNDYGVKATFFVNAHEGFDEQYKRIVDEGHTLGMHSYSHSYRQLYSSLDSFAEDLYELQEFLAEKTGVVSNYYRFPGGSSNGVCHIDMKDCIEYLEAKGIEYYDWNASAQDAVAGGSSATEIVNSIMNVISLGEEDTYIILMHDAANKNTTVEALPIIIERLADMENVVIVPIDDNTKPVQHVTIDN